MFLKSLTMKGFKSFAEKTSLDFEPGVTVVVGPNGSGKSNLADALRWALGEQGRSLRIRRSEDVIWAGSDKRGALGMADVTLVLDNGDALLPVEYAVVELGRRLYRSGENDYLLNRQRVRLKDLVELLDSASLADNAFLFIGQGMVDQALALRPEERRPLYHLLEAVGPDHEKQFRIEVVVDGRGLGVGEGPSRRIAETSAAAEALEVLRHERQAARAARAEANHAEGTIPAPDAVAAVTAHPAAAPGDPDPATEPSAGS